MLTEDARSSHRRLYPVRKQGASCVLPFLAVLLVLDIFSIYFRDVPLVSADPNRPDLPQAIFVSQRSIPKEGDEGSDSSQINETIDYQPPNTDPSYPFELLLNLTSALNDKTLPWDPRIRRDWLDNRTTQPPAMLVMTQYGWNERNPWNGRRWSRTLRTRELVIGVLNHPWFHPTAYQDILDGTRKLDPSIRYYIFLDLETCGDVHYPVYNDKKACRDHAGNRGIKPDLSHQEQIQNILASPFFANNNTNSKIVIFDCNGYHNYKSRTKEKQFWTRRKSTDPRIVLVSQSGRQWGLEGDGPILPTDLGLPPGAIQKWELTAEERTKIATCQDERPFLFSFTGNFRAKVRQDLKTLHNGQDIIISEPDQAAGLLKETNASKSFLTLASRSRFAAVPRGDNLFSYRFSEVMSCGAIPIVYADGWVFPFSQQLLNREEYSILIPESQSQETTRILSKISKEKECQMRRRVLEQDGRRDRERYH